MMIIIMIMGVIYFLFKINYNFLWAAVNDEKMHLPPMGVNVVTYIVPIRSISTS